MIGKRPRRTRATSRNAHLIHQDTLRYSRLSAPRASLIFRQDLDYKHKFLKSFQVQLVLRLKNINPGYNTKVSLPKRPTFLIA